MERSAKRPRLLTSLDNVYNANYDNQHAYYETQDDELNGYEEPEEDDEEQVYGPDQELQRKRARVDFKLKSTFEAIFEKYGKDFEGIGDEIDMRTGEILVNNGHILEMRHEMDAGDPKRRRRGQWSEELDDDMSGSEEDDDTEDDNEDDDQRNDDEDDLEEENKEDYDDDDDALSDEDMVEDDMILRGFAQASQQFMHRQLPPEPIPFKDRFAVHTELRNPSVSYSSLAGSVLPSHSEILAQFGTQLGPEIAKYISKRGGLHDSRVEPAWRIPDIVPATAPASARRPLIKSMVVQQEPEFQRSQSPENAPSIWALETNPVRKRFKAEEDELLLEFVADARRHGLELSSQVTWKQLEAMNPRHDWRAWKQRYNTKFTYLRPGPRDESDLSTSETSASTAQMPDQRLDFRLGFTKSAPPRPSRPADTQRPVRVRKPAQRDGIVSWSEAVATIASVDPIGNAGLLDDARKTTGCSVKYEQPLSSLPLNFSNRRHSLDGHTAKRPVEQNHGYLPSTGLRADSLSGAEDELTLDDSGFYTEGSSSEKAPCPHADCRPHTTIQYGLNRSNNEDLSPMSLHLLSKHRISPFPCGELDCECKGARGYFMQKDLVRHVREAHPYATALNRLRGRVDPDLLDRSSSFERPHESMEVRRNTLSGKQARDSDFMSPQKPYNNHGLSDGQRFSLGSDQDPDKTLTPRAGGTAVSEGASSMHVHPSSAIVKDMSSRINEGSSDLDLKVLDKNPFVNNANFNRDTRHRGSTRKSAAGNNAPFSSPLRYSIFSSSYDRRSRLPRTRQEPKTPCTYPGCGKMISSHSGNMNLHLKVHEKNSRSSTATNKSHLTPKFLPSADIPDPAGDLQSSGAPSMPTNGESLSASQASKPTQPIEESIVDRSYEFSDEEDGIRPVVRRPPPQLPLPDMPPSIPQSFFAPSTKATSPEPALPARPPSALPDKGPSPPSKQPFTTPAPRAKPRKSMLRDVLDSEDFDELSLAEDGFILLSSRPRSATLPKSALPIRMKREKPENQDGGAASSKKRSFDKVPDDEIDELGEDGPTVSSPYQLEPTPGLNSRPKKALEDPGLPRILSVIYPKTKKRHSDGAELHPGSSLRVEFASYQTPSKHQQLPIRTNTPLIDLVKHNQPKEMESGGQAAEIPSTSELGSSPNSQRARNSGQREAAGTSSPLTALVTPHKKTWPGRTVKREDEADSVVTPGGTLRRCGQDGFVCGRAFCFRCRTVHAAGEP